DRHARIDEEADDGAPDPAGASGDKHWRLVRSCHEDLDLVRGGDWLGRDIRLRRCPKPTKPTTPAATRIAPARTRASSKPRRKEAVARSSACWPADAAATWTWTN